MIAIQSVITAQFPYDAREVLMTEETKRKFWDRPIVVYAVCIISLAFFVYIMANVGSAVCDLSASGHYVF